MRLTRVLIIPALGHSDANGCYDRGRSIGSTAELDVIDGYMGTLIEELENERVIYEVLPTRAHPGLTPAERRARVLPKTLVVHLRAGWAPKPRKANLSCVTYGGSAKQLASQLLEALSDWGGCYVHGHQTALPKPLLEAPELNFPECAAVAIEPFQLNGDGVDEYLRHLPELGAALGTAISGYLDNFAHRRIPSYYAST